MQAATIGLDIAKSVFQVHGVDAHGKVALKKRLARAKVLAAQHEAALKERLGAERHRLLLETLRAF